MSEEQLKAAETEASAQVEEKDLEGVEEISEEDLEGVAGGKVQEVEQSMGMVAIGVFLEACLFWWSKWT